MASKDTTLIINAKNNASKEVDAISKSLKALNDSQSDLAKGASKTSTALGGLAADVQKLQRQTDQLKSLGTIAGELDKATAAVGKMESSLKSNALELAQLARDSDAATTAANKLRAALATEESALSSNKAGLKDTSAELTKINKLVADAERAQTKYNASLNIAAKGPKPTAGVSGNIGAPQTSARASAGPFIAADLAAAKASQAQVVAQVNEYKAAIEQASKAVAELKPQVAAASGVQQSLARDTDRAATALGQQKNSLADARTNLAAISDISKQASTALGGVSVSQADVSAASAKMAANLATVKAKLDALSNTKTPTAAGAATTSLGAPIDTSTIQGQQRALLQARKEWVDSQAAVKALAQEMKNADAPTEALGAAFGRAQAQALLAKQAYQQQQAALAALSGSAKSSFSAFEQGSASLQRVSATTSTVVSSQQQLAPAVERSGSAFTSAGALARSFADSVDKSTESGRQSLSIAQRLRGEILSLTASYIGFQAAVSQIGSAIAAYQTLEGVQSRLGAVFNQDTAKVGATVQFLKEQSDRLGISFETLGTEYSKFAVAAKAVNLGAATTQKVFLAVAEAAVVNKLSTEQTSRVFLAFTQMLDKGKVQSQEVVQQLGEVLPGATELFAQALGKTTPEFLKLMEAGKLFADRDTLGAVADQLTKAFGPQVAAALNTATADIGKFQGDLYNLRLEIANGLLPGLRAALQAFDGFAKSDSGQKTFANFGAIVGDLLQVLAQVPKYFNEIIVGAKLFAGIKIAGVFTGIAGSLISTVSAANAWSQQLQLIGPRTQAAAEAQGVFNRGLAQVVSALGTYRTNLLASTASTALAQAGTTALAGGIGILRTALIATGTLARTFLAAFGGPVGLVITAITIAVGAWITSVSAASTVLEEHQRQLKVVADGYAKAKDSSADWAKSLKGITISQAQDNLSKLLDVYKDKLNDLSTRALGVRSVAESLRGPLGATRAKLMNPDDVKSIQDVVKAVDDLKSGKITIDQFRASLDAVASSTKNSNIKAVAVDLQNFLDTADKNSGSLVELADKVAKSEANLRQLHGTATDADRALLHIPGTIAALDDGFDRATAIKRFSDAIDTLKSHIPGLAEELKKLKDITEINGAAWTAMVNAFKLGDFAGITKTVGLYVQARQAVQNEYDQKQFEKSPSLDSSLIERIIKIEGPDDKNPTSSARGIGQQLSGEFLTALNRLYPALNNLSDSAKLQLRYDEAYAKPILAEDIKQKQIDLAKGGFAPTDTNTYLAYFLGAAGALKVLRADPNTPSKDLVSPAAAKANQEVFDKNPTAGDLINWSAKKIGSKDQRNSDGSTKQEKFDESFDQTIKGLKEEAAARSESNREGFIAQQLAEQEAKAQKDGIKLSAEQIADLKAAAGAKYDSAHADEALKASQKEARDQINEIVGLDQQRKVLIEEINTAQAAGDNSKTADLQKQLKGINEQLAAAIPKALTLAKSLGDEKMVAQLAKVQQNTEKASKQFSLFGLSLNQTKTLANSFADGAVSGFDTFVQSVVQGQNAVQALGNAFLKFASDFLRQIADMILKQEALNLLQSFLPSIGIPIGAIGAAHTGGMVGSAAVGGGNSSRSISPAWFANATHYHSGGIAGLRPDELPTILKKTEEVLTTQDPRHRYNAGGTRASGAGGSSGGQPIKQVLVLDQKELANAMASSAGEKVVITHIRKNATTLKQILG